MSKEADLGPQEVESFSTWSAWGTTNVIATNTGSIPTVVELQAGGGSESRYLDPGETQRFARQWAGFTLYVTNGSDKQGSKLHVTVW